MDGVIDVPSSRLYTGVQRASATAALTYRPLLHKTRKQQLFHAPSPPHPARLQDNIKKYDAWPSRAQGVMGSVPQLLIDMETMLDSELSLLGGLTPSDDAPQAGITQLWKRIPQVVSVPEVRIFLAALKMYAGASRVYSSVLGAVHHRVDRLVDSYEQLSLVAEDTETRTQEIKSQASYELRSVQEDSLRDVTALSAQVKALTAALDAKQAECEEIRNSTSDAKKIEQIYTNKWIEEREKVLVMVNQIRDAEEQHQETMLQYEKLKRDTVGVQELMLLYQKTADELQQMKSDFADVVPAKHCAVLERILKDKNEKSLQMKMTFASLRRKMEHLETTNEALQATIISLEEDCRRLREGKGRDTPRPDWENILQRHDTGITYEEQSSQEIAEAVCESYSKEKGNALQAEKEIVKWKERLAFLGEDESKGEEEEEEAPDYFVGLGTGKDVPKYLRWFGQVQNRDLPKREAEHFINDFWGSRRKEIDKYEKQLADERKKKKEPTARLETIEDFMHTYLKAKYGMQARIVDKGYNIRNACKKYIHDADCELFLLIIEGHIPEVVYYEQMKMLERLQRKLEELELPGPTGKRTGRVKKSKINPMLDKFFPTKSDKFLVKLKYILTQFAGDDIAVGTLFSEDREGNQGPFLEAVRDQMVKESLEYYQQVSNAIFLKAVDSETADDEGSTVTYAGIKEAILEVDPQKPAKEIERIVWTGLSVAEGTALEADMVWKKNTLFLLGWGAR